MSKYAKVSVTFLTFFAAICCCQSCTSVSVDYLFLFDIDILVETKGRVGVEGAEVIFIDAGLMTRDARSNKPISLGRTNGDGRLTREFEYGGGFVYNAIFQRSKASGFLREIELQVVHEEYSDVRERMKLDELEKDGAMYIIRNRIVLNKLRD